MTTNSHVFTGMDGSSAVMPVTLPRDGGYSGPFQLSTYFELRGRCKMQKDERDLLEVLIFDEIEDTVGTWLRAIIRRLEKEQTAIRRDQQEQPTSGYETLRGTPLHQEHHPKSAKPACSTAPVRRRTDPRRRPDHTDPFDCGASAIAVQVNWQVLRSVISKLPAGAAAGAALPGGRRCGPPRAGLRAGPFGRRRGAAARRNPSICFPRS